jgi:hypothetical protein
MDKGSGIAMGHVINNRVIWENANCLLAAEEGHADEEPRKRR